MDLDELKERYKETAFNIFGEGNEDSLVAKYNKEAKDFKFEEIEDVCDKELLGVKYDFFKNLVEDFHENYKTLFFISVWPEEGKEIKQIKQNAQQHLELCIVYITEIQNLYLNPINYRLNQLNNEESLSKADISITKADISITKANVSIRLGFASIALGLLSTALAITMTIYPDLFKGLHSNKSINDQPAKIECCCCPNNKPHLLENTNSILPDSISCQP